MIFSLSNLETVINFGFLSFNICSALFIVDLLKLFVGKTPGFITTILLSSKPISMARFLVNCEFATI